MKKIQWFFLIIAFFSSPFVQAKNRACSPVLTPFVCKNKNEQKIGRCAVSKTSYTLDLDGTSYTCTPVTQSTTDAKKAFLDIVKNPSLKNLQKFKNTCDYSSPINFETDHDVISAVKSIYNLGNVYAVRALLFAEENCANETSHELILSWLGNEILINQASSVIQAFFDENKSDHLNEVAKREDIEWRKVQCKTQTCRIQRNTYFQSKLTATQKAQIPEKMEPIRQQILSSLHMISDISKVSFLKLIHQPSLENLNDFKKSCINTSPIDFLDDKDLHQTTTNFLKVGNVFVIRALIHADAHCADIANRRRILSWLGNEILMDHPSQLIEALSFEDQKHELYDIAEMENDYWKDNKCLGDPCETDRRTYFSSKRKALENATIAPKNEGYRRQLMKYLVSDQP